LGVLLLSLVRFLFRENDDPSREETRRFPEESNVVVMETLE
jgi:hypothetical protein